MGPRAEVTRDGEKVRTLGDLLALRVEAGAGVLAMSVGARGRRWLAAVGLTILLVQAGSFCMLWGEAVGDSWSGGDMKFGDMTQHYGAGMFWRTDRAADLYQGGKLGQWLAEFERKGKPQDPAKGTAGFNYVYPPLVAWVAALGVGRGYAAMVTVWFGLSLLAWVSALIGLRHLIGWRWEDPLIWLWALTFPAAYYGLVLGQNHALTLLVVVGTGLLLQQKREVAAGLVLSCLFYKPQWGVFLAVMMGLWGHGRLSAGWALGTLGWGLLMFWLTGWNLMASWVTVLTGLETGAQNQVINLNQTWRAFIGTVAPNLPPGVALGLAGLIWAGATVWLGWERRGIPPGDRAVTDLWEAAALGVFAMPYVMHYDAIMIVPLWLSATLAPRGPGVPWAVIGTVLAGWASINLWETAWAWMAPVWTLMFAGLLQATRVRRVGHVS